MKQFLCTLKITFCFLLFNYSYCLSQEITMQQTLDYINAKFAGRCSIDVSKGILIAVYQVNGQNVREDQVSVNDLDLGSIKYDAKANILFVNCKGAPSKKCVTRELYLLKVYRDYARISWEAYLDDKAAGGMKKALTHMVRLVLESKYKSSEPFE